MSKKFVIALVIIWSVIIIALIGLLVFLFNSNVAGTNWFHMQNSTEYHQDFKETYKTADIDEISLGIANGDISVNQGDTDEIMVEVKNNSRNKITCGRNGNTVEVKQESESFMVFNLSFMSNSEVTVTVPKSYNKKLNLRTSSGDIRISGDYDVEKFICNSSSGSFSADTVKCQSIDINASSGEIRAKKLEGNCSVKTSSGSIRIDAVNGEGSFKTSSGSITTDFEAITGNVDVNASSGSIHMSIREDADCSIDMNTSSGHINSDYPTTGSKKSKNAQIGSGSKKVRASTSSGSISLNK